MSRLTELSRDKGYYRINNPMLDARTFKTVIEHAPLVSIDVCLVCDDQLLLGKRNNDPLKGEWFTPGGRIHKNEIWQHALLRIINDELGLWDTAVESFSVMGIWDHFYNNSALGQDISTHFVNLPHYSVCKSKPQIFLDDQHLEFKWFDLSVVSTDEKFHRYTRDYAGWLLKMGSSND